MPLHLLLMFHLSPIPLPLVTKIVVCNSESISALLSLLIAFVL